MHLNKKKYTKPTCLGYCKTEDYFGVMEMHFSEKSYCQHVFSGKSSKWVTWCGSCALIVS